MLRIFAVVSAAAVRWKLRVLFNQHFIVSRRRRRAAPSEAPRALAFLKRTRKQGLLFLQHTCERPLLIERALIFIQADVHISEPGQIAVEKGTAIGF